MQPPSGGFQPKAGAPPAGRLSLRVTAVQTARAARAPSPAVAAAQLEGAGRRAACALARLLRVFALAREIHRINTHFLFLFLESGCALNLSAPRLCSHPLPFPHRTALLWAPKPPNLFPWLAWQTAAHRASSVQQHRTNSPSVQPVAARPGLLFQHDHSLGGSFEKKVAGSLGWNNRPLRPLLFPVEWCTEQLHPSLQTPHVQALSRPYAGRPYYP